MFFREQPSGITEATTVGDTNQRHHDTVVDEEIQVGSNELFVVRANSSGISDAIDDHRDREPKDSPKIRIHRLLNEELKSLSVYGGEMKRLNDFFQSRGGDSKMRGLISFIKSNADGGREVIKMPSEKVGDLGDHTRWTAKLIFTLAALDGRSNSVMESLVNMSRQLEPVDATGDKKRAGLKKRIFILKLKNLKDSILDEDPEFFNRLTREISI